jgi:hypothetical protein
MGLDSKRINATGNACRAGIARFAQGIAKDLINKWAVL